MWAEPQHMWGRGGPAVGLRCNWASHATFQSRTWRRQKAACVSLKHSSSQSADGIEACKGQQEPRGGGFCFWGLPDSSPVQQNTWSHQKYGRTGTASTGAQHWRGWGWEYRCPDLGKRALHGPRGVSHWAA